MFYISKEQVSVSCNIAIHYYMVCYHLYNNIESSLFVGIASIVAVVVVLVVIFDEDNVDDDHNFVGKLFDKLVDIVFL